MTLGPRRRRAAHPSGRLQTCPEEYPTGKASSRVILRAASSSFFLAHSFSFASLPIRTRRHLPPRPPRSARQRFRPLHPSPFVDRMVKVDLSAPVNPSMLRQEGRRPRSNVHAEGERGHVLPRRGAKVERCVPKCSTTSAPPRRSARPRCAPVLGRWEAGRTPRPARANEPALQVVDVGGPSQTVGVEVTAVEVEDVELHNGRCERSMSLARLKPSANAAPRSSPPMAKSCRPASASRNPREEPSWPLGAHHAPAALPADAFRDRQPKQQQGTDTPHHGA